jgi:hypothetical protein
MSRQRHQARWKYLCDDSILLQWVSSVFLSIPEKKQSRGAWVEHERSVPFLLAKAHSS